MCVSFRCGRPPIAASTAHRPTPLAGVDQHPLYPSGAREFCSEAIARNAARRQGKISVERRRRKATWAKASGSRQERLQWGKAVSPNGTHVKNVRFESATVAGRNLRHEQGGRPETFAGRGSLAGAHFGKRYDMVAQSVRAGLTAQLTGRAENGLCYRSRNASACVYAVGRMAGASSGALTVCGCQMWCSVAVLQVECLQGVQAV